MALQLNGITITTDDNVTYTDLSGVTHNVSRVQYNGTTAWSKQSWTQYPYLAYLSTSRDGAVNVTGAYAETLPNWTVDANTYMLAYNYGGYANGYHLSVMTENGANYLVITQDGNTWTKLNWPIAVSSYPANGIFYCNGIYLICNNYYGYYTTDFSTFTQLTTPDGSTLHSYADNFTVCNSHFFFHYTSSSSTDTYMSDDLVNWELLPSTVNNNPSAFVNGHYYTSGGVQSTDTTAYGIRKLSSNFSSYTDISARFGDSYFAQIGNLLFFLTWTRNHETNYISYVNTSTDTLTDVYGTAYLLSSSQRIYNVERNTFYAYSTEGKFIQVVCDSGTVSTSIITPPTGYYIQKMAYIGPNI